MNYNISFRSEGPAGWVDYREGGESLSFPWERTSYGFTIELPVHDEWDDFCRQQRAWSAIGRREEIIDRMSNRAAEQYYKGSARLNGDYIEIHRGPTFLSRLLSWISGLIL